MDYLNRNCTITIVSNHFDYFRAKVSIFVKIDGRDHSFNDTYSFAEKLGYKVAKNQSYILAKFCPSKNTYAEEFSDMIRKSLNFEGIINCIDVKF